jgi:hypothetical protein
MAKSEYARKLDTIVRSEAVGGYLKSLGFRKRNHTFNRVVEPGLVQVISFQMGAYQVGNPPEVLPYRTNLYGKFTINLSLFVSEIREIERPFDSEPAWSPKKFIPEMSCHVRKRIGQIMPGGRDTWWGLQEEADLLSAHAFFLLQEYGLPFLHNYNSRDSTIRELEKERSSALIFGLYASIMLWKQGKQEVANKILLEDYQRFLIERPNFARRILTLADRMGFHLLNEN